VLHTPLLTQNKLQALLTKYLCSCLCQLFSRFQPILFQSNFHHCCHQASQKVLKHHLSDSPDIYSLYLLALLILDRDHFSLDFDPLIHFH
jgi:hypothetical protein